MKYSNQQMESTHQSGKEVDFVLDLLKKFKLPLTRDNYPGLAYPEGIPETWGAENEAELPKEIQLA